MNTPLTIKILPQIFAVCRLDTGAELPQQVLAEPFFAVVRTDEELSIVLPEENADPEWQMERGWRDELEGFRESRRGVLLYD